METRPLPPIPTPPAQRWRQVRLVYLPRTVFAIGVGILVLGGAFMLACYLRDPAFFRGQTLRQDTPALIVEEPVG